MQRFTVHTLTAHGALGLSFEIRDGALVCHGESQGLPDIIVQAYDPLHDVAYASPSPLSPHELEEESHIHIPKSLRDQIDRRVLASSLGTQVLMQYTERLCPAISPLAALRALLEPIEGINAAIIEANNGAFAVVHRIANNVEAMFSNELPEAPADLIVLSGSDDSASEYVEPAVTRRITIEDFGNFCQFTEDAFAVVAESARYYTLAIGAAAVYKAMIEA